MTRSGHQFGALIQDQDSVHVFLVVGAVLDALAQVFDHARRRGPAVDVFVDIDANHFIRGEETVFNPLLEAVGINRLAKIGEVGNVFGFLGRGGHAEMDGAGEVIEDFTPCRIFGGAATMALVDNDQVEKIGRDISEYFIFFGWAGDGLIERQVNFIGRIDFPIFDLGHDRAEGLEVVDQGLVGQNIAVDQKQDAFDRLAFHRRQMI